LNHPLTATILYPVGLVAVTVAVHAVGLAGLVKLFFRTNALPPLRFWPATWFLTRFAWWLILVHLVEIAIWGMFYLWQGCLPDGSRPSISPASPIRPQATAICSCRRIGGCSGR